ETGIVQKRSCLIEGGALILGQFQSAKVRKSPLPPFGQGGARSPRFTGGRIVSSRPRLRLFDCDYAILDELFEPIIRVLTQFAQVPQAGGTACQTKQSNDFL